ncbi:hypothetical protein EIP91_004795 [Steccherinum ochraceum]|uniref:MYND-type domain-containing protein n=1 Tax=Steccherinum ochraceum TaxID=92696 RepID=A0A4R0RAQ2_9APHY|nr:hypothetical protein EIP91_004795 [Steccherinum ochraceum]
MRPRGIFGLAHTSYAPSSVGCGVSDAEPSIDSTYMELPESWRGLELPLLAVVREEAFKLRETIRYPPIPIEEMDNDGAITMDMVAQLFMSTASLTLFCELVDGKDIPPDIAPEVIRILQTQLFLIDQLEVPDAGLKMGMAPFLHIKRGSEQKEVDEIINQSALLNRKLVTFALREDVDQPLEALRQLEQMNSGYTQELVLARSVNARKPWLENLDLYLSIADALVFANRFDEKTKALLENLLVAVDDPTIDVSTSEKTHTALCAHMHLALVFQELGTDPIKQAKHTEWAAKYLRKHTLQRDAVSAYIRRRNQPSHPVAEALGPEWFENTQVSLRDEKRFVGKMCAQCLSSPPKLLRCRRCQMVFYWSVKLSLLLTKGHWKAHKVQCDLMGQKLKQIEAMKTTDPAAAQRLDDVLRWQNFASYSLRLAAINAVGLHHAPERGREHVMLMQFEHCPSASQTDYRHRIRVVRCGVYKTREILNDIERLTGMPRGAAKKFVEDMEASFHSNSQNGAEDIFPLTTLTFCKGIDPCIKIESVTKYMLTLSRYDPEWRKMVNPVGEPPAPFRLRVPNADYVRRSVE